MFGLTHIKVEQDKKIAEMLPDIPLIMGGHEHHNMLIEIGNTKIAKADASFDKAVKAAAKTLKIDADSLGMIRFEAKVSAIKDDENSEAKMKSERQFIQTQIENVQEELHRFEENMGFFGP